MKKGMIIVIAIVAVVVGVFIIRKLKHKKLVNQVREKYGDIPGLSTKSATELLEMLKSGGIQ